MTYAHIVDAPVPIEAYEAVHQAMIARMNGEMPAGFLVHIARATDSGFQVIEVWESKEDMERAFRDIVIPTMEDVTSGGDPGFVQPPTEFEVRGLVLAGRQIVS